MAKVYLNFESISLSAMPGGLLEVQFRQKTI